MAWKPRTQSVSTNQFEVVPDGEHLVKGVTVVGKWAPEGKPTFLQDQWKGMAIGLKFTTVSGSEGPVFKATPAELFALALVFGVNLAALKPTYANRTDADMITKVIDAINANQTTFFMVTSKNGWVNNIKNMVPPALRYTFRFEGFTRPNRQPGYEWTTFGNSETILAKFSIVGDDQGRPTIWTGYPVAVWMNNAFITPESYDKDEEFAPIFKVRADNGEYTVASKAWLFFIKLFLEDQIENHTWTFEETLNPQIVLCTMAEKVINRTIVGLLNIQNGNADINFESIVMARGALWDEYSTDPVEEEPKVEEPKAEEPKKKEPKPTNQKPFMAFVDYVKDEFGEGLFEESELPNAVVFTAKGKEWAAEWLGAKGAWERAQLPEDHMIEPLNTLQVQDLIEAIKSILALG